MKKIITLLVLGLSASAFAGQLLVSVDEMNAVHVQEASLPKGKHKLLMVVEDTSGRRGNKTIEFEVQ